MPYFNKQAEGIIERFEYEFYIVRQIRSKQCLCVNYDTKQADPKCELCLGTGYKIRIRKIKGASQDTDIPTTQRTTNDIVIGKIFYIKEKHEIEKENLIIARGKAFKVHEVQENSGYKGRRCFNKVLTIKRKHHSDLLIENFNKIINKR